MSRTHAGKRIPDFRIRSRSPEKETAQRGEEQGGGEVFGVVPPSNLPPPLEELKELNLFGAGLASVCDISNLHLYKNLRVLNLHANRIKSMVGLENFSRSLEELVLSSNQIQAIENTEHLTSLRILDLSSNALRSLGGLAPLTELRKLMVAYNQISSLEGLQQMWGGEYSLLCLDVRGNCIDSFHQLTSLGGLSRLERLRFSDVEGVRGGRIGNFICQHPALRTALVRFAPSATFIDEVGVTKEEREAVRSSALSLDSLQAELEEAARKTATAQTQASPPLRGVTEGPRPSSRLSPQQSGRTPVSNGRQRGGVSGHGGKEKEKETLRYPREEGVGLDGAVAVAALSADPGGSSSVHVPAGLCRSLLSELSQLRGENGALRMKLETQSAEVNRERNRCAELVARVRRQANEKQQGLLSDLARIDQEVTRREAVRERVEAEVEGLAKELAAERAARESEKQAFRALQQSFLESESRQAAAERERDEARHSASAAVSRLEAGLQSARGDLGTREEEVRRLSSDLEATVREKDTLSDGLRTATGAVEETQRRLDEYQRELGAVRRENGSLVERLERQEQQAAEAESRQRDRDAEFVEARRSAEVLRETVEGCERRLRESEEVAERTAAEHKRVVAGVKEEKEMAQEECERLRTRLAALQHQSTIAESARAEQDSKLGLLYREKEVLEEKALRLQAKMDAAEAEGSRRTSDLEARFASALSRLQTRIQEEKRRSDRLEESVLAERQRSETERRQAAESREEAARARAEAESAFDRARVATAAETMRLQSALQSEKEERMRVTEKERRARDDLAVLREEVSDLQRRTEADVEAASARHAAAVSSLRAAAAESERQRETLSVSLKERESELRAANLELQALQGVESRLAASEASAKQAQMQVAVKDRVLDDQAEQIRTLQERLRVAQQEQAELTGAADRRLTERIRREVEEEWREEVEGERERALRMETRYEEEIDRLQTGLEEALQRAEAAEGRTKEAETAVESRESLLAAVQEELSSLQSQVRRQKEQTEKEFEGKIEEAEQRAQQALARVGLLSTEVEEVRQARDAALADLAAARGRVERREAEMRVLISEAERSRQAAATRSRQIAELAASMQREWQHPSHVGTTQSRS
uniref:Uncharacterized protein n=1 Tax=Chromera velia CCMP2878 TaxID=1169474 RepID=A0A0G4GTD4_9ALVE|eukprot:Cvel_23311.t1-p1 / transcript=Cvel_23311.t1 / gene=Cvel_23311 / organism=Chromera_velia_CCMP2878 / gene_product=Leucine-rich repeat and coiled-coil, putative / transcript_product=Leucine-rich repeat and coiled-coil, putative / location=Cvel_scaffold2387:17721-21692(-) / protein_length=1125 / sequence_SO=supercontig / SO=protein_coding / is_pseudo=false